MVETLGVYFLGIHVHRMKNMEEHSMTIEELIGMGIAVFVATIILLIGLKTNFLMRFAVNTYNVFSGKEEVDVNTFIDPNKSL